MVFYELILTLVGVNVRINHETNNVRDLTAPLSMKETLSRMTSSCVFPGPCGIKCSPYIIGKLVTIDINDFGAMVTQNSSTRIIAHANW